MDNVIKFPTATERADRDWDGVAQSFISAGFPAEGARVVALKLKETANRLSGSELLFSYNNHMEPDAVLGRVVGAIRKAQEPLWLEIGRLELELWLARNS